jgi:hypothetical protein
VYLNGTSPRGRDDPPRIVANPWNSVTLVSRGLTTGKEIEIKPLSLRTLLIQQLGLTGLTAKVVFRFLRVDVWLDPLNSQSGLATSNLGLLPTAINETSLTAATWLEDIGTPVKHAHCHYIWSKFDQDTPVVQDYPYATYRIDTKTPNLGFTQHVNLLWRSNEPDLVPSFRLSECFEELNI